jgi:hypothetical protein
MSAEQGAVQEEIKSEEAPPERNWESEARGMGWAPKESFKGDPQKWVDAKTYVERGEQFIPILQHTKRELQGRLNTFEEQNRDLQRRLELANKALDELKTESHEQNLESAQEKKASLYSAIAAAREENDVVKELQLREQLDEVNEEIRAAKRQPSSSTATPASPPGKDDAEAWRRDPDMQHFLSENEWYGRDQERTGIALGYMNYLVTSPETKNLPLAEKLSRVAEKVNQLYGGRRTMPSKVEGGRTDGSGRGSGGGGKGYQDMPAAAKEQCDKQAQRFIGRPNGKGEVKYKDIDAYRAEYARSYFAEDWGARHLNA